MRKSSWLRAAVAALSGCASVGPATVKTDRFDYGTALANSWKEQTLLNIVKLRYLDMPVFVDVASVVAGYSLQTGVNVGGVVSSKSGPQNYATVGGQAIYTDRPTITYVPMTGEKFLRGLITPIDPKNIFFMLQSGYSADFILALTVESLNGVRNSSTARGTIQRGRSGFRPGAAPDARRAGRGRHGHACRGGQGQGGHRHHLLPARQPVARSCRQGRRGAPPAQAP